MEPMRHQDYLAMSEENRRLNARIEELTKPKPKRSYGTWLIVKEVPLPYIIPCAVMIAFIVLVGSNAMIGSGKTGYETATQYNPCYFVGVAFKPNRDHKPWANDDKGLWWSLYSYDGDDNTREDTAGDSGLFHSRAEAWSYLQRWKLRECR